MAANTVIHYSDILCIWAYAGQPVLTGVAGTFGSEIEIELRYCSVFGDTVRKIDTNWKDRGGFEGYARHVQSVADGFPGVDLHPDTWFSSRPGSSASPHLFLKAVACLEARRGDDTAPFADRLSTRAAAAMREAFFTGAENIAYWEVQRGIARRIGVCFDDILGELETRAAMAGLAADYEAAKAARIEGSPTYVLNQGRQKLYGNVSRAIVEANIRELLEAGSGRIASPC
jgi:predicted DsbA family dithiol-disulfide isomerase